MRILIILIIKLSLHVLSSDEQSTDITLANFQSMTPWRKRLDHGYWRATRKGFLIEAKSGI